MLSLINSLHKWMKIGLSIKKLYIKVYMGTVQPARSDRPKIV